MTQEQRIAATARFLFLILIISLFGLTTVTAAPQTKTPPPPRKTPPTSSQMTNIPFYSLRDGLSSTLTLNNLTISAMPVTITIYNTQGKAQMLSPVTLDPHSFKQIELGSVVVGDDFDSGNVQIAFNSISMAVTSQVSVYSLKDRVSFESREADMMEFESSRLAGILSLPKGADGFLAVTNTAMTQVTVQLAIGSNKKQIPLLPRQTELVKLSDYAGANVPGATLISLQHNGMPGDIIATGYVLNMKDGYSSAFTMSDPGNLRSNTLAGVHFRAGKPDPAEVFPEGTQFRSPLLLANLGTKPVNAKVSVDYTIQEIAKVSPIDPKNPPPTDDEFSTVSVKQLTIAPGDVQRIELSDELAALGITGPLEETGVDITYDGATGSLIGQLTSADQSGDYAFEVPIKDPADPSLMVESVYPWTIENGTDTVLHLKNTSDKSVNAFGVFAFPDSGRYTLPQIALEPHQSIAIDIQKLKDSKKPDVLKQPFPANEGHGLVYWHQVIPATMIGRAEQTNVKEGIARSFSCPSGCCDYYSFTDGYLDPSSLAGPMGGSGSFQGYEDFVDCSGYGETEPVSANSWTTSNSSIATVSSGNVSYIAEGTADIGASLPYPEYSYDGSGGSCRLDFHWEDDESGGVTVDPPTCDMNINFSGSKTTTPVMDNLLFGNNNTECTESLGLVSCTGLDWWHGNMEGTVVVSNDASRWSLTQEKVSYHAHGFYTYSGTDYEFDDTTGVSLGNDPLTGYSQNDSGTKELFWIDGPGLFYYAYQDTSKPITALHWVLNLTTTATSLDDSSVTCSKNWHVDLQVATAGELDGDSEEGYGWISTDF